MPRTPSPVSLTDGDVLLMVGTMKGAFLFHSDASRESWRDEGPHFPGEEVYALALDQRAGRRSLWAAPGNAFFGVTLRKSDDGGGSWSAGEERPIANGVPSDFGFALAMHPRDPDTVYCVPMESDQFRCCPEAKLRVYRTRNAGEGWEPLTEGLPQEDAYETVLRDALDTDRADPAGVYFGTRSGRVYASRDDGDSWTLIHDGLPPVVCVKAAVVGAG